MRIGMSRKKIRLTRQQKRMEDTLVFLLRLIALSIPLYIIMWMDFILLPLQSITAGQVAWALNAMGFAVTSKDLILSVGSGQPFIFFIGPDCTGWKSMLAFIALIFATLGAGMRKRIAGTLIGIPLIHAGNLLRIIAVVLIERSYGLEAAKVFHDWLWQAGLIALVLALWLAWLRWDSLKKRMGSLRLHIISQLLTTKK